MTFDLLPNLTPFIAIFAVAVVVGIGALATALFSVIATNRPVRIARRQSPLRYYGHLVLGR